MAEGDSGEGAGGDAPLLVARPSTAPPTPPSRWKTIAVVLAALAAASACAALVLSSLHSTSTSSSSPPPRLGALHRPSFHFTAESGWINDPYGYIWAGGRYHVFYQRNPNSTQWGPMKWGHATTRDLVRWCASGRSEVAVRPTPGAADEGGCWDGRVVALPGGGVVAVYTGVRAREPPNGVFAWVQSQMLMRAANASRLDEWRKADKPLLGEDALPDGMSAFRDPFVLEGGGGEHLMLVASGYENGTARFGPREAAPAMLLYRTADPSLAGGWALDSVLLRGDPVTVGHNFECGNLFDLGGGTWLLTAGSNRDFVSLYYAGAWEPRREAGSPSYPPFEASRAGAQILDHGNLYAVSGLRLGDGRVVLQGWSPEGRDADAAAAQGWAGALSVPRVARADNSSGGAGGILQAPLTELERLREGDGYAFGARGGAADGPPDGRAARHVWVEATVRHAGGSVELTVLGGVSVRVPGDGTLCVGAACGVLPRPGQAELQLTVLADGSVVEVFADGGRFAMTARAYPAEEARTPELRLGAAGATVVAARVWAVGSMWLDDC